MKEAASRQVDPTRTSVVNQHNGILVDEPSYYVRTSRFSSLIYGGDTRGISRRAKSS